MPYITDREAETIIRTVQLLVAESRNPVQRKNRIVNLADRITATVKKSQRRKPRNNGIQEGNRLGERVAANGRSTGEMRSSTGSEESTGIDRVGDLWG